MQARIAVPTSESVFLAALMFTLQIAAFFFGVVLLFIVYESPLTGSPEPVTGLYPYVGIEIGIFAVASLFASVITKYVLKVFSFSEKIWDHWQKYLLHFLAFELIILLLVSVISSIMDVAPCSTLVSLTYYPTIAKPWCGASSINFFTPWFFLFAVVTIVGWSRIFERINQSFLQFMFEARKKSA